MTKKYQLWCYYETEDVWKMEGFFSSISEARSFLASLRSKVDTPCMPDWEITEVEVYSD